MRRVYDMRGGWQVVVWYGTTEMQADEILDDLAEAGCAGSDLRESKELLWSGDLNQGMTFVNGEMRRAVVVIGEATSMDQYANTIGHEQGHLVLFVADVMGVDLRSEMLCYMLGDVAQMMWQDAHRLTCPTCGCH